MTDHNIPQNKTRDLDKDLVAHFKRLEAERRFRESVYYELVHKKIIPLVDLQIRRILR